jgi:sugar phosphate isomerase/epimerase
MRQLPFSVGEMTTYRQSFAEDLVVYREAGVDGIGIDASKVQDDERDLKRFKESGLAASVSFGKPSSILPLPNWGGGPVEPAARIDALCRGIRRMAAFGPTACACVTGPLGDYSADEARDVVVTGLRRAANVAADEGMKLALEPMHSSISDRWSFITTLPEAVSLLDEVGAPNTGIVFDIWHLWDTPDLLPHIRALARRFVMVHVNDWRRPTRSWCDRVLPGDGVADVRGILGALDEGGFEGWFELEIFSDDGSFGSDYADSLWKRDPVELIRSGRERFMRLWAERATTSDGNEIPR